MLYTPTIFLDNFRDSAACFFEAFSFACIFSYRLFEKATSHGNFFCFKNNLISMCQGIVGGNYQHSHRSASIYTGFTPMCIGLTSIYVWELEALARHSEIS